MKPLNKTVYFYLTTSGSIMRSIKEVIRLSWVCGLSNRTISASCATSRSSVANYLKRIGKLGLTWKEIESMSDEALESLLYVPEAKKSEFCNQPDWTKFYKELRVQVPGGSCRIWIRTWLTATQPLLLSHR